LKPYPKPTLYVFALYNMNTKTIWYLAFIIIIDDDDDDDDVSIVVKDT